MTDNTEHKRRKAFTLAEILITLGIIGVVAAMTIPTLIANTNAQKYRSQLKKTISTLSQAARMSQAQYGFDYAGITTQCGANAASENPESTQSICAILNGTLTGITYVNRISNLNMQKGNSDKKYEISSPYLNSLYSQSTINQFHAYILSDGSIFAFCPHLGLYNGCSKPIGAPMKDTYPTGSDTTLSDCVGFIDVNGTNLPNREVSCSTGSNSITKNNCVVKNDAKHMTDIYPVRIHDSIVIPATAAARYVLQTAK